MAAPTRFAPPVMSTTRPVSERVMAVSARQWGALPSDSIEIAKQGADLVATAHLSARPARSPTRLRAPTASASRSPSATRSKRRAGGSPSRATWNSCSTRPGSATTRPARPSSATAGDFVTAPEISPLFAQTLARQARADRYRDRRLDPRARGGQRTPRRRSAARTRKRSTHCPSATRSSKSARIFRRGSASISPPLFRISCRASRG